MAAPRHPIPFKRGSTFAFKVKIPRSIPAGYYREWKVESQIRRAKNDGDSGHIADLSCRWEVIEHTRVLVISDNLTNEWPLGLAEVDVLLTSPDGIRQRTETLTFDIDRGITR